MSTTICLLATELQNVAVKIIKTNLSVFVAVTYGQDIDRVEQRLEMAKGWFGRIGLNLNAIRLNKLTIEPIEPDQLDKYYQ